MESLLSEAEATGAWEDASENDDQSEVGKEG